MLIGDGSWISNLVVPLGVSCVATWSGVYFQEGVGWVMVYLDLFRGWVMAVLVCVLVGVGVFMLGVLCVVVPERGLLEDKGLEGMWRVAPVVLLIGVVVPSLKLLYLCDECDEWGISLSGVGYQWYWEYFYPGLVEDPLARYCVKGGRGAMRVMDVDTRGVVPVGTPCRVVVTGGDVIHRWAMPRLGVKVDAIPGRVNGRGLVSAKCGTFYGQCSEICGANHSFMPVVLDVVPMSWFIRWVL